MNGKKFELDAEVQSQMMKNTVVGKVDDKTAMISTEVFNPNMVEQFMSSDELNKWRNHKFYLMKYIN